jgi:polar amino acid transport system substrate-binding protein
MKKIVFFILLISYCFSNNLPSRITIARENVSYPPLEFYEDGQLKGFHIELIEEIAKNLNIEVCWVEVPWKRALNMLEHGNIDGVTYISKTAEREKWAIFKEGNILSRADFSFLVRKEPGQELLFQEKNLKEILDNNVLLVVGGFVLPENIKLLNPVTYETIKINNLIDMLNGKRYNIALVNKQDYLNLYSKTSTENNLLLIEPPISTINNYIAFSKTKKLYFLSEKFEEEIIEFKKSNKYKKLIKKYGIEE